MIPFHLHHAACGALFIVALYGLFRRHGGSEARDFLFPFVVTAFAFGAFASYLIGTEFLSLWHLGALDPITGKPARWMPQDTFSACRCFPCFRGWG